MPSLSTEVALRVLFCVITGIGLSACETPAAKPPPTAASREGEVHLAAGSPKLSALRIDTVFARHERVLATLPAHVSPDENHTARVLSPVTGRITELLVQAGDRVVAGQALARLISADAGQASSDLDKSRAVVAVVDAALARANDLYTNHVIALRELEQARSDAAQAHAEEGRARDRVSQLGLQRTGASTEFVLRAPIAGIVVERTVNPGAEVRPDAALPLFTISSLQQVWLTTRIFQRDWSNVRNGVRLIFTTDAVPGREFEGRISFVAATLDPVTRTGLARAVLSNADGALRPEMFGEARLLAVDSSATPVIATRALITHGAETVVYVERTAGVFVRRVVRVGDDDGKWATISTGLRVGERVVTDGSILLDAEANHGL